MSADLRALEEQAERARRKLEEARRRAAVLRAAEDERRAARLMAFDRARLDAHDDATLEAEVMAARQRLEDAILADPVYAAAIELQVAQLRRYDAFIDAGSDAMRLGEEFNEPYPPVATVALDEYVPRVVTREASRRADELREARAAEREAAGEGQSDQVDSNRAS